MTRSTTRARCSTSVLLAVLALVPAAGALAADGFYDATLALKVGDDARFFLNLTNQHFASSSAVAVSIVKRCPRPENDFLVIMLLAAASGRKAEAVLAMRSRGQSWSDILFELRLSPQILFAGMDRDPGPPYGRAWGHWKDHKGKPKKERFVIPDGQVVDLVKLQIAASYYRVSPYTIIRERQRGVTVERYAVVRGRPAGAVPARNKDGTPARGARPERGEGHGHGQDPKNR